MSSILTNAGAMTALRVLGTVNADLKVTQGRLTSGLTVSGTRDDSAKFVRAQGLRGEILMQQTLGDGLNRWKSTTDVAIAGAQTVSDLVNQLGGKALLLQSSGSDVSAATAIRKDMEDLLGRISAAVDASAFSGVNLLKGKAVTQTTTRTTYSLPDSTINPAHMLSDLVAGGAASAMPPGSNETLVSGTRRLTLPTSDLTPSGFEELINPLAPEDPSYLPITTNTARTFQVNAGVTSGRINLLADTGTASFEGSSGAGVVEIWQNGVRVAASGADYVRGSEAVAPATPEAGPFILSFDYDPANGQDIEIRVPAGNAGLAIEGLQLQDPALAIPEPVERWKSAIAYETSAAFDPPLASADAEQVAAARDDPFGERALPEGVVAEFALDPGPVAAHIDIAFDAYERADTTEIWQGGIRLAATGQPAEAQGAQVGEGAPRSDLSVLSFDYDPARGPLTVTVNNSGHDASSAWAVGAISMRPYGSSPASTGDVVKIVAGTQTTGRGNVRYDFATDTRGGTERIVSRDLSLRSLGLDPIDWEDPDGLAQKVASASGTVGSALRYFGAHSGSLEVRQHTQTIGIDIATEALGNLVDADMSVQSAQIAALRLQQQLAAQTLAITNQQPEFLLALFRT
jgi:flagellin-like hook-associated protein FlgL